MAPPVVAVLGSTGFVGKFLMSAFLDAVKDGRLQELRVLTSEGKLTSAQIQSYIKSGAVAFPVDYEKVESVTGALEGVDVAVSALANFPGSDQVLNTLLYALVEAKVKVYFPSEFGLSRDRTSYANPGDACRHFNKAKELGLNPIRMQTSRIMEWFRCDRWFGLDVNSGVWTVIDDNKNNLCAMTSGEDVGRFTLQAVLLAHSAPAKCPDQIEVCSDNRKLTEYAKVFTKVAGKNIVFEKMKLDLEQIQMSLEETQDELMIFEMLQMMLLSRNAFDYSQATGNQLLNPNESLWKLKKIENYAQECEGFPNKSIFIQH